MIQHLSLDEALAIHERLIEHFGGPPGVRDSGLLESALFRPHTGYYKDIVEMAAALFESLIMIHPFVDGNKHVAFFATDVFLRLNGWKLEVETDAAHIFIIDALERSECDYAHVLPWLQGSIEKL